jgi:ATP-dependent RNA helicase SUPV3L1/SUV3
VQTPDPAPQQADTKEEEGPKTILVWRPVGKQNRGNQRHNAKFAGKSGSKSNFADSRPDNRNSDGKNRSKNRGKPGDRADGRFASKSRSGSATPPRPPREKKIDPDSPFAKLAALKENLNKGE